MRESLTVFAILLILVLSAALAVPHFVDWNAERGLVETQLSEVLGRPVKVRGGIDLRLLPTPYLRLANVQVGRGAAEPKIEIDEIQLEIALTALLRGEVDFVEAKLVHPRLTLQIKDGAAPFGPLHQFSGQMRFERISIENGALSLSDPATGRLYAFNNISFGAEATSLAGPFKAQGQFAFAGQRTYFNFAAGERQANRQRIKLIIDENKQHPRADLDAGLIFPQSRAGFSLPSIDGQIKLSRQVEGAIMPWQLSGRLQGGLRKAAIGDLALRLGDEDHAVDFAGTAEVDLGANPRANATLKASQIDLDRLLSSKGAPPAMQRLAHALADLLQSHDLMASGIPITVAWSANAAVLGDETLRRLSGGFSVAARQAARLRFEADGPGRSHLGLDGTLETGTAAGFKGRIDASAADMPRLSQWLRINLPENAVLFSALPIHSFDVSGTIGLSGIGLDGRNLSLRLDQSMLSGTLTYTKSVGGAAARLFADLSASQITLDKMPDLTGLAAQAKAMDLSLRLLANAVKVGGVGQSDIATGQITLKLAKTGARTTLDEFAATGLDGANITARGQWDGKIGAITGMIDSARLDAAAAFIHRLAPGSVTDALRTRAEALSPIHLAFSAQADTTARGALALKDFQLTGTANATQIAAKVAADPKDPAALIVSGALDAADALTLIRQIGVSALPLPGLGAGHVVITAHGRSAKRFTTDVTAALAGTDLGFHGKVGLDLAAPNAIGMLNLASPNLTPLFEMTGLAFPAPATRLAADLAANVDAGPTHVSLRNLAGHFAGTQIDGELGYDTKQHRLTGTLNADRLSFAALFALALGEAAAPPAGMLWSNATFPAAMIDPPPTDLTLTAKHFDLAPQMSGRDAKLHLAISGGRAGLKLMLRHVAMKLGGGRVAGALTLRRDGTNATAAGHLRLTDYDLALPSARARLSGALDLAGTGNSAAAVFAGLAGSGTFTFANLVLPRTDPDAMAQVFKAVEDDSLGLDESEIDRALTTKLDKDAAHVGNITFDVGVAAGVLRLAPHQTVPKKLTPGLTETLQASLDLGNLELDQRTILSLVALPKNWSGAPPQLTLIAKGAIANPVRTIESANFVNALAARAIARESARIQAQEFDVHEQTFFYNRLKSERRRQQAKLRAQAAKEEAAKKAAAQKRKAEEAARTIPLPTFQPRAVQVPKYPTTAPTDPLAAGRY